MKPNSADIECCILALPLPSVTRARFSLTPRRPGRHGRLSGASLTQAVVRPLPWPHELPDPGISHQFSSSSPDSGISHRFPGSVPPRTQNPAHFPRFSTRLTTRQCDLPLRGDSPDCVVKRRFECRAGREIPRKRTDLPPAALPPSSLLGPHRLLRPDLRAGRHHRAGLGRVFSRRPGRTGRAGRATRIWGLRPQGHAVIMRHTPCMSHAGCMRMPGYGGSDHGDAAPPDGEAAPGRPRPRSASGPRCRP
jgi:hypothetical protein